MVQLSSIAGLLSVIPLAHAAAAVKAAGLAPAAEKVARSRDLFDFETVQLTDSILEKLSNQVPDVSIFSFRTKAPPSAKLMRRSGACKTYPGDAAWPSDEVWNLFDTLLGGALIRTVPDTAICYSNWNVYDASACQNLTSNYANSYLRYEIAQSSHIHIFAVSTNIM